MYFSYKKIVLGVGRYGGNQLPGHGTQPAKSQNALDLYIEAMEPLSKEQMSSARETLDKLRSVAAAARADTEPSDAKAFQQRKCRRLRRYPTMDR